MNALWDRTDRHTLKHVVVAVMWWGLSLSVVPGVFIGISCSVVIID